MAPGPSSPPRLPAMCPEMQSRASDPGCAQLSDSPNDDLRPEPSKARGAGPVQESPPKQGAGIQHRVTPVLGLTSWTTMALGPQTFAKPRVKWIPGSL